MTAEKRQRRRVSFQQLPYTQEPSPPPSPTEHPSAEGADQGASDQVRTMSFWSPHRIPHGGCVLTSYAIQLVPTADALVVLRAEIVESNAILGCRRSRLCLLHRRLRLHLHFSGSGCLRRCNPGQPLKACRLAAARLRPSTRIMFATTSPTLGARFCRSDDSGNDPLKG